MKDFFMGGHSKRSCSVSHIAVPLPPPPPIPDLIMTGDCTPDVTGNYFEYGVFGGEVSYQRDDELFYIWYDSELPGYICSAELGVAIVNWFYDSDYDTEPLGTYNPEEGVIGNPVCSLPV